MKRCIQCGKTELVEVTKEIEAGPRGGPEIRVAVTATVCADPDCGESYYSGQELQRAELTCALHIAATQVMTGRLLGYCRRVAGITLAGQARQYGISPRLLKRIEATEVPLTSGFTDPVINEVVRRAAAAADVPIPAILLCK